MMRYAVPTLVASAGVVWAQFGNNGAPVRSALLSIHSCGFADTR